MTNHRWLTGIGNLFIGNRNRRGKLRRSNQAQRERAIITAEILETKVLLAADTLGLIQGTVFNDVSDNGLTGEDPLLTGAMVQLYKDGGNLSFDNGAADDTLVGSMNTIAGGNFSFENLASGRYFVRQQAIAGYMQHAGANVVTIDISPTDALGTPGTLVDDFILPIGGQTLSANAAGVATSSSFSPSATSIGGERDMTVTATLGSVTFEANGGAFPTNLNYNANFGATGNASVVWDGTDGNATTLDPSGLAGADLTTVGETGFLFNVGTSQPVTLQLIVHSGAGNSSTATINLLAAAIDTLFVPYSSFATTTGTGANFASVGAIELLINAPVATTTTVTDLLRSHGPTSFNANFANFIPMTLGDLVFDDINNNGIFDSGTEVGINGVAMTLFADTNGNNTFDGGDVQIATTTTAGGGLYSFGNLFPGDYIVRIDSSNFGVSGPLNGFQSSTGNGIAPDADVNSTNGDDNGDPLAGAIVSLAVTMTNGAEPTNDGDTNPNTNLSLDFGVFGSVDIVVTKTDNVDPVIAGSGIGNLVYTVTALNSGPGTATGLTLSDTGVLAANLPAGVTFVSAVGSGSSTFNTTTGLWTVGTLASGSSATLTVTLTVGATASDSLVISNTAALMSVNETEIDAVPGNDTATETTNVDRSVDIAVTKLESATTVIAGSGNGNLTYTITATNNGPSDASGVTLSDTNIQTVNLPAGVTFVSATGSGSTSYNSTTGVWTIGNLATGASATLTAVLTVGASASDTLVIGNTASLLAVNETDSNPNNNSASVTANVDRSVDIAVTKTENVTTVVAGSGNGNLVYTITASNNGPSNASGVTLNDTGILTANLPAGVTFISAVGSGSTSFNSTTGVWTIGNLATGASATLTATLTVGASASDTLVIGNTASLLAVNETDSNPNNNSASVSADVNRLVDIAITKAANATTVTAGSGPGNLVYTVTARNNGPSNASGVTVSDMNVLTANLPVGMTFVSATGSGASTFNSTTGIWTIGNLTTGGSEILTVTLTAGAAVANNTTIVNTASLNGVTETDSNPANNSQSVSANIIRDVDIVVTKTENVTTVIAGSGNGNLVYTITAHNSGPSNGSGLTLMDTNILAANLPVGVSLVSAAGSGSSSFNSSTGIWTIGNLSAGATETLTVTLTVGSAAANGLIINNTASLATLNENDRDLTNNSQSVAATVTRNVDIQITKAASATTVVAGSGHGNLVYTITARNNGISNASGVTVSDAAIRSGSLPTGVTLNSAIASGSTTYNASTGLWTIGNLAVGASATLTVTVTIGASASTTLVINNTATLANVNETDTVSTNNSQSVVTNVNRSVDIAVTKSTTNNPVVAGSGNGNLVYTITARNNGPSDASGVSIRDNALLAINLPSDVIFVSAVGDSGSTYNQATGIWTINNLASAATRTLTVTITVGANATPQTYNNTVEVATVNEADSNPANNNASASTMFNRSVDIQVTKTATTGPIIAGSGTGNLVYTVTARNNGPSNSTGVTVSDTGILTANLPAGVTFVSATGSGSSAFNATTGTWTIGNMASGGTATLTVVLTVGATASDTLVISNTASLLNVTETDSNPANNSQTVTTNVDRRVDIVVTKTASAATINAGSSAGNLVYTITATNAGRSDATGVTISDFGVLASNLPTGVTLVSAVGSNGSAFNSATGIWTIGNLSAGASRTLTLTLTVGVTAADKLAINNTATVATVTETETNLLNNSQTTTSRVVGVVDLVVVKTAAPNPVLSPGILTYTVLVTNKGTAPATGVVLTDNLGPGMTFSSATTTNGTVGHSNGIVTMTIGTLNAGASATLTLYASVRVTMDGTLVNTAVATADQPDLNMNDNTSSIQTRTELAPTSLSGVVFQDLNSNGVRDANELRLAGVQVVLFGTDIHGLSVNQQTLTDANGAYSFTKLVPGKYSVYEIQPGFFVDNSEVAGTGAAATVINDAFLNLDLVQGTAAVAFNFTEGAKDLSKRPFLASSQNVGQTQIVSLPVAGTGSLSGTVATDANRSNTYDSGDVGIPGVIVTLAGNDSAGNVVLIHQSTDSLGRFSFQNLPAGQYSIRETQPSGLTDGAEQAGTILPDQVLDNLFSAIALPNGGHGTGYSFLELPTTAGTTTATSPTILTPTTANVGLRPTISWTSLASATKYDVWVSQIAGNVGVVYRNQNVTGTSITIPTDLALGSHRVWVRSINGSGVAGPWSQPAAFNVATQANALQVLGVSMNTNATLDWANVPNATSYDMRLINVETGVVLANVTNLPTSQYSGLSTLPPGKYRYFVRGNTASTTGQWSDGFDYTILSIPTLKTVTATNTATPTLHWNPVTGATMYEVWLSKISETGGAQRVTTVDKTNATSTPIPANLALGNYRYWVRAIDSQGKMTTWSSPSNFKVETVGTVLTPTGATNSTTPTFTWKPVTGAVRYDLWVADASGTIYVRDQNVTGTSYTASKGFVNGDYRVWVMPVGATTSGKWSSAVAFKVNAVARPELTSPGATTNSTPTIQWTPVSNAVRYELWVDKVGGPSKVIHSTNLATNSFRPVTSLVAGNYRAWVRAFDANGAASIWSLALNFRVV